MTLHISAASIHGLVAVCAVAHRPVTYNYSPLTWWLSDRLSSSSDITHAESGRLAQTTESQNSQGCFLRKANGFCGLVQINRTAGRCRQVKNIPCIWIFFKGMHCTGSEVEGGNHVVQEIKLQASKHNVKPLHMWLTSQQWPHCVLCMGLFVTATGWSTL